MDQVLLMANIMYDIVASVLNMSKVHDLVLEQIDLICSFFQKQCFIPFAFYTFGSWLLQSNKGAFNKMCMCLMSATVSRAYKRLILK